MNKRGAATTKAIFIFLFVIFVILALSIALWVSQVWQAGRSYTEEKSNASVKCIGMAYEARNFEYADNILQFELENFVHSDHDINALVIVDSTIPVNLSIGRKNFYNITINITNNFTLFVKGCNEYPRICTLSGCV